jgi:hypothetical protein
MRDMLEKAWKGEKAAFAESLAKLSKNYSRLTLLPAWGDAALCSPLARAGRVSLAERTYTVCTC